MTDEERQRQMDFIINTLANITATQERTELERKADAVRTGRLEDSMVTLTQVSETLTQLAQRSDERLDEHQEQIKGLRDVHQVQKEQITDLRDVHQEQITDLREAVLILTKIVSEGRNSRA